MNITKDKFLILTLLVGLFLRLIFLPTQGFKFDVDTWFAWAERINSVGFSQFYTDQVWTGYPPGFLYILGLLGLFKNLFSINPTFFYMILKLPSIVSELLLGFIIYNIPSNLIWRRLALLFVLLNPSFIFNSAVFGQFDGLFSLFLLLSIIFLTQNKLILSSLLWGISFSLKPQAIFITPVLFFYFLKNISVKNTLFITFPFFATVLFSFLPFFSQNIINGPLNLVNHLIDFYPYNSIFAYNLWGILGFWVPDSYMFLGLSYKTLGYITLTLFLSLVLFNYLKYQLSLYAIAALSNLAFFFLLTRMHERYLYPSIIFLVVIFALKKSKSLVFLTTLLSIFYFLNLYHVYIYYNKFYLGLNTSLYFPLIYGFLDHFSKLISLLATITFIIITVTIYKLNYEPKKN